MERIERDNGVDTEDPLTQAKQIVGLVLKLPVDNVYSTRVLDAVGTVYADLEVLGQRQRLERQIASSLSTDEVDGAIQIIQQAAALRPADDEARDQRELVLEGLRRIRQATGFNQRVGQSTPGIAIVQVGITPGNVESAMSYVLEAKQLVEASQPSVETASEPIEKLENPTESSHVTEREDTDNPTPSLLDLSSPTQEEIGTERFGYTEKAAPTLSAQPQNVKRIGRRALFKKAAAAVIVYGGGGVVVAEISLGLSKLAESLRPPEPTEQEKKDKDEEFIRRNSLTENPFSSPDGWSVSYPNVAEDEELVDMFEGNFRQVVNTNRGFDYTSIPLYIKQGEYPVRSEYFNMKLGVSVSKGREPLSIIKIDTGGGFLSGWDSMPTAVLSGRVNANSPEKRSFADVIQFKNKNTKQIHYASIKPILEVNAQGEPVLDFKGNPQYVAEILYMKKINKK